LNILEENTGAYDHYVIMPHFKDESKSHYNLDHQVINTLKKIPSDRLLILDNFLPDLGEDTASVFQDFKHDIYNALCEGIFELQHYDKLMLVYPKETVYPYPKEILDGFRKFCTDFEFDNEILETIYTDMELRPQDAYILIEENDLVNLVKQVREQGYTMGKDIGIVSYNDTPLKELLGITVISTDFKLMGETAAYMIRKNKKESVKNIFNFINRGSL
jgi:DNA-binding LacI/PurR family transcriptional regulator